MRAALVAPALALGAWQSPAQPIELLFLGHNNRHHHSGRYAPMLKATIAADGARQRDSLGHRTLVAQAFRPASTAFHLRGCRHGH